MKDISQKILIFAGTTEGRKLSEYLVKAEISHTVCVATEYGEIVLEKYPIVEVHKGRMEQKEIERFLQDKQFTVVIDATHPFAKDITENIKAAVDEVQKSGIKVLYLRIKRDNIKHTENNITYFKTNEECAKALENIEGNIFLTTGSKNLSVYCVSEKVKNRLYIRVLPSIESLMLCEKQGICTKHIIAMQGPFTTEINEALIRQYNISCLVTKESGITGGYLEKLEAAKKTGIKVCVIGCPEENVGYSFIDICNKLEKICGKKIQIDNHMEIILAGAGMGHESCLTKEVEEAINRADIILGAERLLENIYCKSEKHPYYTAEQIIPYLQNVQKKNLLMEYKRVVVLFSGDSGFYSGCRSLYLELKKQIREKRLNASVRILPGISSVAYLAAYAGESYQNASIYSMHGKKLYNLAQKIKNSPLTFLLTSGVKDINKLGQLLVRADMQNCEIITGYQLSYENQRIEKHTPLECLELKEDGLYTCIVKNPYAIKKNLTYGIADKYFIRGQVPMSKEEIREVSICKLRLHKGAVVYDIGSGTGSIAIEIAALSSDIQVYAIEKKEEALSLIQTNKDKFELDNITIKEMIAPDGLSNLPTATHAFIGGSGGRLKEIITTLRQINNKMRVVINAVTIETICTIKEILSMNITKEEEIIQLNINKVRERGNYHLMQSENPVWICTFIFNG